MSKNPEKSESMLLKRYDANILQINRYRPRIARPFIMAGRENAKVSMSFCNPLKLLKFLSNRAILRTLKILAIWGRKARVESSELLLPINCKIISSDEADTTIKSNTFQTDRKYAFPKVASLSMSYI